MITNEWLVWAMVIGCSGLSIWLANNTKWGKFLGFVNMGLLMGFILTNIGVAPISDPAYNVVTSYFVPVGITLMLFKCNLRKLAKCGPKIVGAMVLAILSISVPSAARTISPSAPISTAAAGFRKRLTASQI